MLFFGEVDGLTEVYVNGRKIDVLPNPQDSKRPGKGKPDQAESKAAPPAVVREGQARPRTPFEVDVSAAAHAGENVVALRVDHMKMTDLSLGGILRPVLLLEKPE